MLRDLQGRVAWVTGAGSGIGNATVLALADAGMNVFLSGRRTEPLEKTAEHIRANGGKATALPLDVADSKAVTDVAARIRKESGRLDVLVQSAGLNRVDRGWSTMQDEDWEQVIRVNLDGAYYCCRAVLPIMREQQDGLIVNISSWAGRHWSRVAGAAYSASKSALDAMTETINMEECVNGIRACALCPGEVSTAILDKRPVPVSESDRRKMIQPEDMGEIVLFLSRLPTHVCVNDMLVSPTHNRAYINK